MQRTGLFTQQTGGAVYMRHGLPLYERPELASLKTLPTTHLEEESSLARYLPKPPSTLSPDFPAFSELCDCIIERRMLAPDSYNSRSSTPCARPAPVKLIDCPSMLDFPVADELVCGSSLNQLYERKVASAKSLLDQLEVSHERHQGLKNYLTTQKDQLRHNSELACSELQAKRNALVAQIDSHLHEATKTVQLSVKEKERFLSEKSQEIDIVLQEISQKVGLLRLATTAEAKSKFVQEFSTRMEEAETALKLWVVDCEIPADWVDTPAPNFSYILSLREPSKGPLAERDVNREKDQAPTPIVETRLGTTDKPILASHSRRHHHKHSKVPKLNLPEEGGSDSLGQNWVQEKLVRQNKKLVRRLEKLESAMSGNGRKEKVGDVSYESQDTKVSEMESGEGTMVSISALISDTSEIQTDRHELSTSDCIRLYIPQGYPPYSCYYHISLRKDTTAGSLLSSLISHMGLSPTKDYAITLQKKPTSPEDRLSAGEFLRERVGGKREAGWPRLFLKAGKC